MSDAIPTANPAPPLLVVICGPSGVGKDAVLTELKQLDRPWRFVVTVTTRPQRVGEQDGVDYIFLEPETFQRMRARDEFIECAEVYGRWYGVPRSQVRDGLKAGQDVILKVDVQGAATVRQFAPEALTIFLVPGTFTELEQRLTQRMTESDQERELRLQVAHQELEQVRHFDYRVVNRDHCLDWAIRDIDAIIAAEKCRVVPRVVQLL